MSKGTIIFSATFCQRTGARCDWDEERGWVCPDHDSPDCGATFQNTSWLDELAGGRPDIHPHKPTEEQIEQHRKRLESGRIHHELHYYIEEPLTMEQWIGLDDGFDRLCKRLKIKEYWGDAGPIPLPPEEE